MIHSLDTHDSRLQRMLQLVYVPEELELGGRGANDEDGIAVPQRSCNIMEEVVHVVGMIVLGRRTLRMTVNMLVRRPNRRFVEAATFSAKNARLVVIDPDYGGMRARDRFCHKPPTCTIDASPRTVLSSTQRRTSSVSIRAL